MALLSSGIEQWPATVARAVRACPIVSDENEAALVRVVDFFRRHGHTRLGIQLSHSGRKGSARRPWEGRGEALTAGEDSWATVSASELAFDDGWPQPAMLGRGRLEARRLLRVRSPLLDPLHANRAVVEGRCDLAAIARGMLHDPHWAGRAAAALGGDVSYPPQYIRGYLSSWLREQRAGHGGA